MKMAPNKKYMAVCEMLKDDEDAKKPHPIINIYYLKG